jgi:hypothetical protein
VGGASDHEEAGSTADLERLGTSSSTVANDLILKGLTQHPPDLAAIRWASSWGQGPCVGVPCAGRRSNAKRTSGMNISAPCAHNCTIPEGQ